MKSIKSIKNMKTNYIIQLILSFISIALLIYIYNYLDSLKDCSCFIETQTKSNNKVIDIEFLKFYQILEIIAMVVFIGFMGIYKYDKVLKGGKNKVGLKIFLLLTFLIVLFISGYVSYNSILFYLLSKKNCKCVNKWQKYFIYIQGIFNSINFLRLFSTLILVLLLITFNFFE